MAIRDWLAGPWARGRDKHRELERRVASLEQHIRQLSERDKPLCPPVVIRHADKVVVERVDYSSHFGTVDIDSLSGQLNIGVNIQRPLRPDEPLPGFAGPIGPAAGGASSTGSPSGAQPSGSSPSGTRVSGPACHIRPRRPPEAAPDSEKPAEKAGPAMP